MAELFPISKRDLTEFAAWTVDYSDPHDTATMWATWAQWQEWACEERGLGRLLDSLNDRERRALRRDVMQALRNAGAQVYRPGWTTANIILNAMEVCARVAGTLSRPCRRYNLLPLIATVAGKRVARKASAKTATGAATQELQLAA